MNEDTNLCYLNCLCSVYSLTVSAEVKCCVSVCVCVCVCLCVCVCICALIRVDGVHAIIVTDREGVPLLQGTVTNSAPVAFGHCKN